MRYAKRIKLKLSVKVLKEFIKDIKINFSRLEIFVISAY